MFLNHYAEFYTPNVMIEHVIQTKIEDLTFSEKNIKTCIQYCKIAVLNILKIRLSIKMSTTYI